MSSQSDDIQESAGRRSSFAEQVTANFEPLRRFLDRMAELIREEYGEAAVLESAEEVQSTAQNAHEIRYSLRHTDEARLSLTFLLQGHERSTPRDISANPGQVEQHVFRLDELDELKDAVREKII